MRRHVAARRRRQRRADAAGPRSAANLPAARRERRRRRRSARRSRQRRARVRRHGLEGRRDARARAADARERRAPLDKTMRAGGGGCSSVIGCLSGGTAPQRAATPSPGAIDGAEAPRRRLRCARVVPAPPAAYAALSAPAAAAAGGTAPRAPVGQKLRHERGRAPGDGALSAAPAAERPTAPVVTRGGRPRPAPCPRPALARCRLDGGHGRGDPGRSSPAR